MQNMGYNDKFNSLKQNLAELGKVLIAYSGGVDSTFLLKVSADTLGCENVTACIGVSASLSGSQYEQAVKMAQDIAVKLIEIKIDELGDINYTANKADRCFYCKSTKIVQI